MNRSDLIATLAAQNATLTRHDMERVVGCIFDTITDALAQGHSVTVRNFGTFSVRQRKARLSHNPRTGERIHVHARNKPAFRMGRALLGEINKHPS